MQKLPQSISFAKACMGCLSSAESSLDFQHLFSGIVAAAITDGMRGNDRATVGTFDQCRSSQGRYRSPTNVPAGLGNLLFGYWVFGHRRSLPFGENNPQQRLLSANRSLIYMLKPKRSTQAGFSTRPRQVCFGYRLIVLPDYQATMLNTSID